MRLRWCVSRELISGLIGTSEVEVTDNSTTLKKHDISLVDRAGRFNRPSLNRSGNDERQDVRENQALIVLISRTRPTA